VTKLIELFARTFTMFESTTSLKKLTEQLMACNADEFIHSIDSGELAEFLMEYYEDVQNVVQADLLHAPAYMIKHFVDDPGEIEIPIEEIEEIAHQAMKWLIASSSTKH